MGSIIVVDDNPGFAQEHAELLTALGYSAQSETDPNHALERISEDPDIELMLLDLCMPQLHGLEVLKAAKSIRPNIGVIIATVAGDIESAVQAIRNGAFNYLLKPLVKEEVANAITNFYANRRVFNRIDADFAGFFTVSPALTPVFAEIRRIVRGPAPIVLVGEPGTGKHLLANIIHGLSPCAEQPLVSVDMRSIPAYMFDTELFGYLGTYSASSHGNKMGAFEMAENSTLLITAAHELDQAQQKSIMHVVQSRTYLPLGDTLARELKARLILTVDSDSIDSAHSFAISGLLEELRGTTVFVPPLRDRGVADIDLLASYFLSKYASQYGKVINDISDEALSCLRHYNYPGNVAELEKIISLSCLIEEAPSLLASSLPRYVLYSNREDDLNLDELKFRTIMKALRESKYNQTVAANRLGIARGTLNRLIQLYKKEGRI